MVAVKFVGVVGAWVSGAPTVIVADTIYAVVATSSIKSRQFHWLPGVTEEGIVKLHEPDGTGLAGYVWVQFK